MILVSAPTGTPSQLADRRARPTLSGRDLRDAIVAPRVRSACPCATRYAQTLTDEVIDFFGLLPRLHLDVRPRAHRQLRAGLADAVTVSVCVNGATRSVLTILLPM